MSTAALTADGAALPRPAVNPWIIALAVTLATFMEVLDTSIANVSLPHIAGSLSAGTDESTWVLTSYLVSNAIVLPLSGWISSIIGRKRFYMSCVAIFTVSSLLCGLAPNLGMLIFFRILQGAGGGGLQPSEQAILADTFPPAKRGMAFAVYGLAVVLAPAIGPTLGGWITDNFTWRWIFLLNIPVGILSLMLTSRLIQDPPYLKRKKLSETKIDYIGLGLVALGLGTLQIVLDKGQREDWFESHFIVDPLGHRGLFPAVSDLLGVDAQRPGDRPAPVHQPDVRRVQSPDVHAGICAAGQHGAAPALHADPAGLYRRTVRTGVVAGWLQPDAADAAGGLYALPVRSSQDDDVRAAGPFFLLFHMTNFTLGVDFRTVVFARMIQTMGLAFLFVPINTAAYAFLPKEKNNAASGLMNLARNIGGSVGISIVTTMLDRRQQFHLNRMSSHLSTRIQSAGADHASGHGPRPGDAGLFRFGGYAQGLRPAAGQRFPPGQHAGLY